MRERETDRQTNGREKIGERSKHEKATVSRPYIL
jgi:hypothetical protein